MTCNGTDDALLTRQEDNERTFLLSRWFHCVKLSPDVIETDHPFHALFDGEAPAHLFLAGREGQNRIELKGDQSRTELWKAMNATLSQAYEKVSKKGPKRALSALFKLLDKLDQVDEELALVQRSLDKELEDSGKGTRKVKKLTARLEGLRSERSQLRAQALKASVLKLRDLERAPDEGVGATPAD